MRTIWKFILAPDDVVSHEVPAGATPLSCGVQLAQPPDGTPSSGVELHAVAWLLVDRSAPSTTRRFLTIGTGKPLPDGSWSFVGTIAAALDGRNLVWHVFVDGEE